MLLFFIFIAFCYVLYQLSPILTPFFVAALLAYLGDPLVDRLESWKLSRTLSVGIVFLFLFIGVGLILIVLLPLLGEQLTLLASKFPQYIEKFQTIIVPKLQAAGMHVENFNLTGLKNALTKYWSEIGGVATDIFDYMSHSSMVVLTAITNILLIPVITFYLLRDWDVMIAKIGQLIPRRYTETTTELAKESNAMLAGFIRGQLMVMAGLAIIYTIGLKIIGLQLALLLGVIAGVVSFVPYLGLIVGISLAGFAAYFQFGEWMPVLYVVIVFVVAQAVEGVFLTPRFVGENIGLHPVAVIFAVMAGGQLFGFAGILLALPVTAVIMVLLRFSVDRYVKSSYIDDYCCNSAYVKYYTSGYLSPR